MVTPRPIGRIECEPGRFAYLGDDRVWRSDECDQATVWWLNTLCGLDCNSTIDPVWGSGQLHEAEQLYGVRSELLVDIPELPPGAVP